MTDGASAPPLCVNVRLTPAEYRSGVRLLTWRLPWARVFAGIMVLAGLGALAALVIGYRPAASGLGIVAIGYAVLLALVFFVAPWRSYSRFKRLAGEQTYCFSDREVTWNVVDGQSQVKWSYFADMVETRNLFIVRQSHKRLGLIIPRRVFSNADDLARFRRLAQLAGKKG